ncbi:GNAT family N-acetyltransferase [uncultured Fusobacterium sp.]|uniref:GNAT family N-acetyltransferase n=1 Tax=uncultured Fusobacterium sp. TaxID=159267 RepID=UPI0025D3289F|nr:GNAT family N-acetyltransferase [uncultured Fusobacterium sp.]
MIRKAKLTDAKSIINIYNYYIKETTVTFEIDELTVKDMEMRIEKTLNSGYPFIVYEINGEVKGYAYVKKWRERASYKNTLETSIYVDKNLKNNGIGKELYKVLIKECKNIGAHVLIGVLSETNSASKKFHKNIGFEKTGHFKEVANKFDKFIDVEFWSLMLKKAR